MDDDGKRAFEPIPPMSGIDRVVEGMSLLGLAGCVVLVAVGTMVAPAEMPMHFGADGQPDRYGSKAELWIMLAVMGLVFVSLWAPTRMIDQLRPYCTEAWLANSARQLQLVRSMLLWMGLEFVALLNLIIVELLEVATFRAPGVNLWPVWFITSTVGVTLLIYTVAAVREHRRQVDSLQG
jgi:uncharacterized membrane protein